MLLPRQFASLPLVCPHGGADRRIVALITAATPGQRGHKAYRQAPATRSSKRPESKYRLPKWVVPRSAGSGFSNILINIYKLRHHPTNLEHYPLPSLSEKASDGLVGSGIIPGANEQEKSKDELIVSLRGATRDIIGHNRQTAGTEKYDE